MALRYGARRRRRNAVAYGKHGKVLRWMIVRLMVDYDWKAPRIERHLSFQGRFRTISVATIRRIVKIWRETGDVATPREGTRRRQGSMLPQHWQELRRALHDAPDLFLDEMQTVLWLAFDVRYSIGVILGTMKRHGYTRRVLKQLAERRDAEEERTFIDVYSSLPGEYFVFVDETRKDPRGLHRKFGYGLVGTRTSVTSSFQRSSSYSATGVLSLQGMIGYHITAAKGVNALQFLFVLAEVILPLMSPFPGPNSVLVLDNAPVHHCRYLGAARSRSAPGAAPGPRPRPRARGPAAPRRRRPRGTARPRDAEVFASAPRRPSAGTRAAATPSMPTSAA
ncbi:DDE superfamily endonuclease [Aureococcus anophagefferens]|nr:DDE superfamily endonuclease [Aureococcus anophagefferens]